VATIEFNQKQFECESDETILDCLERNHCPPPSSCRSGLCHTCLMRAVDGSPPTDAQVGLKESLVQQNYFLACSCVPNEDMKVILPDESAAPHIEASLIDKTEFSPLIMRLRFKSNSEFVYKAGQFTNLYRDEHLARSYSIASVPTEEDFLEFHIEKISNGVMSSWIFNELAIGDAVQMSEALGECYYSPGQADANLLLIGTGSGLAPLYGILRDALHQGHKGEIHLYHGSGNPDKLYLVNELKDLAAKHANVFYTPCLSQDEKPGFDKGRADEIALANHKDLKNWRVYLCGHPDMVNNTKRKAFLSGASLNEIFADPFEFAK